MRVLTRAFVATLVLIASSASATHIPNLKPRETTTTDSLTPWVTVDANGTASTVTPHMTTISGSATLVDGAPAKLTATVQTYTNNGQRTTSTGTAPQPTATATDGAGSFEVCSNTAGTNAPWCTPKENTTWYPDTTYYFIWDATYFNASNTTVRVVGNYINSTTGQTTSQAFQTDQLLASWGFQAYTVKSSLMPSGAAVNISLHLAALVTGGQKSDIVAGPTIRVAPTSIFHQAPAQAPTGLALYIGLPTVAGFVIVCIVGTCVWNRNQRKIGLGNVMSRSRHGYGVGKSARSRMGLGGRKKKAAAAERIQLMEQEVQADGGQVYRDEPDQREREHDVPERIGIPRRDSDALGSLAGTPTEERRMDFNRPGTKEGREQSAARGERNHFKDELRRQDDERF